MSAELSEKEIIARLMPFLTEVANMRHFQRQHNNSHAKTQTDKKLAEGFEKKVDARLYRLEQEGILVRKKKKNKPKEEQSKLNV